MRSADSKRMFDVVTFTPQPCMTAMNGLPEDEPIPTDNDGAIKEPNLADGNVTTSQATTESQMKLRNKGHEQMSDLKVEPLAPPQVDSNNDKKSDLSNALEEEYSDDSAHYDNALYTIEVLRINLQMEEKHEKDNASELVWKGTARNRSKTKSSRKRNATRRGLVSPTKDLNMPSISKAKSTGNYSSGCDNTVACSFDSSSKSEDEASQESDETEGKFFFGCTVDSILDAMLGHCYLSDESSLTYSNDNETYSSYQSDDSFTSEASPEDWSETDSVARVAPPKSLPVSSLPTTNVPQTQTFQLISDGSRP